jgi:hypothetical protein
MITMRKVLTKDNVKPSNFNLKSGLLGSNFRNSEKETISCNVIKLSLATGDEWLEFSFEKYAKLCLPRKVSEKERDVLNLLVRDGVMSYKDGMYSITDHFVNVLAKFVVS